MNWKMSKTYTTYFDWIEKMYNFSSRFCNWPRSLRSFGWSTQLTDGNTVMVFLWRTRSQMPIVEVCTSIGFLGLLMSSVDIRMSLDQVINMKFQLRDGRFEVGRKSRIQLKTKYFILLPCDLQFTTWKNYKRPHEQRRTSEFPEWLNI